MKDEEMNIFFFVFKKSYSFPWLIFLILSISVVFNYYITFSLWLKHLLSFMSRDIFVSKFQSIEIIILQSMLVIYETKHVIIRYNMCLKKTYESF